ncbi:MAG: hypothetical protein AABX47_04480 [Nanoarchaeota archaeon]
MEPRCPVCSCPVGGSDLTVCPSCGAMKHRDCSEYYDGCGIYGCRNTLPALRENDISNTVENVETNPVIPGLGMAGLSVADTLSRRGYWIIGTSVAQVIGCCIAASLYSIYPAAMSTFSICGTAIGAMQLVAETRRAQLLLPQDAESLRKRDEKTLEQRVKYSGGQNN